MHAFSSAMNDVISVMHHDFDLLEKKIAAINSSLEIELLNLKNLVVETDTKTITSVQSEIFKLLEKTENIHSDFNSFHTDFFRANEALQIKTNKIDNEVNTVVSTVETLASSTHKISSEIAHINPTIDTVVSIVETLASNTHKISSEIARINPTIDTVVSIVETLASSTHKISSEIAHIRPKIDTIDFRVNLIKAGIDFTSVEVGTLCAKTDEVYPFAHINAKVLGDIRDEMSGFCVNIGALDKTIHLLTDGSENIHSILSVLCKDFEGIDKTLQTLKTKTDHIDNTIIESSDNVHSTLNLLRGDFEDIDTTLEAIKARAEQIDHTINAAYSTIESVNTRVDSLESKTEHMITAVDSSSAHFTTVHHAIDDIQTKTQNILHEIVNQSSQTTQLMHSDLDRFCAQLSKINTTTDDIFTVVQSSQLNLNGTNTELNEIKSLTHKLNANMNATQANTDLTNAEMASIRYKIHEMLYGTDSIRTDLKTLGLQFGSIANIVDKIEISIEETKTNMNATKVMNSSVHTELALLKTDLTGLLPELIKHESLLNTISGNMQHLTENSFLQQSTLARIENYTCIAVRRCFMYCGNDIAILRTLFGYITISTKDLPIVSMLMESGDLEVGTRLLIESILRHSQVFVDVGANIGMHTIAAGQILRERQGKVYAFEPYHPTVKLLEQSVIINGLTHIVDVIPKGVSNKNKQSQFYLGSTSGHHSLYPLAPNSEKATVNLVCLNTVVDLETKVDLIKIDVEGHELSVLESAIPFIEKNDQIIIIVEFAAFHLERIGLTADLWIEKFTDLGLVYKWIEPLSGRLETRTLQELIQFDSSNLLFANPNASIWSMHQ